MNNENVIDKELSFESAYNRLEKILNKMNKGDVGLEESISLYEEADKLISICSKKINSAEKKIKILIKNRSGEIETDKNGSPILENFEM